MQSYAASARPSGPGQAPIDAVPRRLTGFSLRISGKSHVGKIRRSREFPDRQPEKWPRERSIEHKFLTPVFGTAQPPKGLSGAIRRFSYARYSEGRAAHWLLLMLADRVDAVEEHVKSFATLHPDNPITETGIKAEFTHHGFSSRIGRKRTDLVHQPLDPVIVAGPWVAAAGAAVAGGRALVRSLMN